MVMCPAIRRTPLVLYNCDLTKVNGNASCIVHAGDSGGPVYMIRDSSSVTGAGTIIGDDGSCLGGWAYPISALLSIFGPLYMN